MRDYRARLRRLEEKAGSHKPQSGGPPILVVSVSDDRKYRFEVDGESFEVNSEDELYALLERRGWQPLRVLLCEVPAEFTEGLPAGGGGPHGTGDVTHA